MESAIEIKSLLYTPAARLPAISSSIVSGPTNQVLILSVRHHTVEFLPACNRFQTYRTISSSIDKPLSMLVALLGEQTLSDKIKCSKHCHWIQISDSKQA